MIATAHINFDRSYFELQYDEWLRHRSRFKKYEIWFALALTLVGMAMTIAFQQQRLVGTVFTLAGVYEFLMAATHKRRWVKARVATIRADKSVELVFDTDSLTSTSANGTGTIRLAGFAEFTQGSHGFFLIPDTGVSLYIPRAAIEPKDSYSTLVELLSASVGRKTTAGAG